jgi:hypothetical protein
MRLAHPPRIDKVILRVWYPKMRAVRECPSSWKTTERANTIAHAIPNEKEPKLVVKRNKMIRNEISRKIGIPKAVHILIFDANILSKLYQKSDC